MLRKLHNSQSPMEAFEFRPPSPREFTKNSQGPQRSARLRPHVTGGQERTWASNCSRRSDRTQGLCRSQRTIGVLQKLKGYLFVWELLGAQKGPALQKKLHAQRATKAAKSSLLSSAMRRISLALSPVMAKGFGKSPSGCLQARRLWTTSQGGASNRPNNPPCIDPLTELCKIAVSHIKVIPKRKVASAKLSRCIWKSPCLWQPLKTNSRLWVS